jgi:hypothetical protein
MSALQAFYELKSEIREYFDAKKVLPKISGKRPGKKCKGSYIAVDKKCNDHYTNGKLNEKGKASAQELAGKVRDRKGLPALKNALTKSVDEGNPKKVKQKESGANASKPTKEKVSPKMKTTESKAKQKEPDRRLTSASTLNTFKKNNSGDRGFWFTGDANQLLKDIETMPGAAKIAIKAIKEKNQAEDAGGGGTLDRVGNVVDAYHGKFNGGKGDSHLRTGKHFSSYLESAQTVLNRPDVPMSDVGVHAIAETYKRFTNTQKNRFAYEAARGNYQLSDKQIDRLPKDVARDVKSRMKRTNSAIEASKLRQAKKSPW